jgi:hypothetical protein
MFQYSDISEVCDLFAIALKECKDSLKQEQRIEFAEQQQYSKLIQEIENFIN